MLPTLTKPPTAPSPTGPSPTPGALRQALTRDRAQARAFGAAAAEMPAMRSWSWEDVAPRLRDAWMAHQAQHGDAHDDWRLSWPAVRDGWRDAGGGFAPLSSPDAGTREWTPDPELTEQELPTPGMHVYDAFGEPAGRVKHVRRNDFLLARPLARDLYVPFETVRERGAAWLRLREANARLGALGWGTPRLFGLVGGHAPGDP